MFAGAFLLFAGYTLMWWGWERLGGNVDLMDLIVPGRLPTFRSTHAGPATPPPVGTGPGTKDASGVPYYLQPNPQ